MAATSGLTRPRLSSDLGVGLSTLNKWVQQHPHDDLMIVIDAPFMGLMAPASGIAMCHIGCCKPSPIDRSPP